MNIYIFDCPNPKGHFGYGHSDICYFSVPAHEVAQRVFTRYTNEDLALSVGEAVERALESFQPKPHVDAGYYEPIRD